MKTETIGKAILLFVFFYLVVWIGLILIDIKSVEVIEIVMEPCRDINNMPFEDELCEYEKTCSWLGWEGDFKCKDVDRVVKK